MFFCVDQLSQFDDNDTSEQIGIARKIETLEDCFNNLRKKIIYELATKPDISVETLLDTLTSLPVSLKKEYESSIANRIPNMDKEKQIGKLFSKYLNPLLSFMDYGLIEYFIKQFGSDALKREMQSYCREMVIFMKETTIKQLIDHLPGQPEIPPKFSLIAAKIGQNASECTLEQLNVIRKRYCSEIKLSEIVFHLVAVVESNSFIVRWLVPSAIISDIMKSTMSIDQSFYQEHKITFLTLDEMWLFLSETESNRMWLQMDVNDTKFGHQLHTMYKQLVHELEIRKVSKYDLSLYLLDQRPNLQRNVSIHLSEAILRRTFPLSVFNFRFLVIIIERFGSDCLKKVTKSYCSYIMTVYTKQSTAQQLIDLSPIHFEPSKYFLTAECRIMKKPSDYRLEKLLNFQNIFCSIFKVYIMIHKIKPDTSNSFMIIWLVPSGLAFDLLKSVNTIKETKPFEEANIVSLQLGSGWLYHHQLTPFGDKLRERYQQSQGSPSPVEWIPSPTKKIFRLAMIQRKKVQQGHIDDRFVQMTITGRIDDILHAKSLISLEHIFRSSLHGGEIILIEGAPGSGKSTLTVHICQRWGKGELFQQFTVVILVQLRDPAVQRAQTIADLLPVEIVAVAQELATELVATNGRGVLWVLDGWDELPPHLQQDSIFHKLLSLNHIARNKKRLLYECSVIVTSRPISSGDLHPVVSSRIEVLGFTLEEQRQYFTECLKVDTKPLETLLEKIQENPVIQSICYLPLNAAFVVHTFKYKDQSLPNTEYEIYLSVIISCIQRHFEREGRSHDLPRDQISLDDLSRSEAVREPFQRLSKLAYYGVMENKVTFSSSDLPQGSITLSLLQVIESFLQSGKSVFYNFLHLSIQEVLSAHYIATQLSDDEQVSQFQQLFNQPRFAAVFQFYAAITKLKTIGIQQVIARLVQSKSKPLLLSLLHCLHEAQDPSLCRYVAEHLDASFYIAKIQYVRLDLIDNSLSPLDCLSISYFLSSASVPIEGVFTKCSIDDLSAKNLAKYLDGSVDHVSKASIDLQVRDNDIHDRAASHIARTLNFIEHLDLSDNPIEDTGALALSEAVRETATLKTLQLFRCDITARGAEDLSRALAQNSSLEKLDISWNNLWDNGISHVAKALKQNKQLKELWISECGMTDKGAAYLASALSVNNSLEMLHMGGTKGALTEGGLSMISQSLANNSEFVKLAIPYEFGYFTADRLSQKVNEARWKNGLAPIEIKGKFCVGCMGMSYLFTFQIQGCTAKTKICRSYQKWYEPLSYTEHNFFEYALHTNFKMVFSTYRYFI